ncbi:MAG: carbamate kinase [Chloroherpetonaceae bacterium]
MPKALIAIGGNSLIRAGQRGTLEEQFENAYHTAKAIARIINDGWEVVVTHGNGPQVGAALIRSERAVNEVYTHTLDMCVATTQSEIGYILERAFIKAFNEDNIHKKVLTIPTMVIVDENDPAFDKPSKPVGPFYTPSDAEEKQEQLGWKVVEDASRGWRRVVPSPEPIEILELDIIKQIMDMDIVTIALGGGGIPVIRKPDGTIEGSEAVIDKDRSSALLANGIDADIFIISTDADKVYLNYKKKNQKGLDSAHLEEIEKYYNQGHFPPGNMGPKIEAVMRYLRNGGKKAIITTFEYIGDSLEGKAGTTLLP